MTSRRSEKINSEWDNPGERPAKASGRGSHGRQTDPQRGRRGKILSPARRRQAVSHAKTRLGYSQRRICRALGISRSAVRYEPQPRVDESALTGSIVGLAGQYGRYGYRRVHALLESQGWQISHGRVMRIWRREGLKVPSKQPNEAGCGSTMVPASGCAPSGPTMCGPGTSCSTEPMTVAPSS
jgi:hypothetical protein